MIDCEIAKTQQIYPQKCTYITGERGTHKTERDQGREEVGREIGLERANVTYIFCNRLMVAMVRSLGRIVR